ncbi:hypothetical protein [Serratia microhaemolytica]|uniref:hypothetical protein n=1 Tax=Serratia microhaemolytica TaxID=2675110 RepID=UPI000FDEAB95|nr:hypothetical protein [Serratia microhaemolytica]
MSIKKKLLLWSLLPLGLLFYYFRSYLPIMFFTGKPYAEIEATIPPDMKLRVGASYRSSACTQITFSNFGQIFGRQGWSKEYTPNSQGKVTAKIYRWAWGPCNWGLNAFSISTAYTKIPPNVLESKKITDEIKQEVVRRFERRSGTDPRTARLSFVLIDYLSKQTENDVNHVSLHTTLTPSISKLTAVRGRIDYDFFYDDKKRTPEKFTAINNLPRSRKGESLKIKYQVSTEDHILYKEYYPDFKKNTSRLLE